MDALQAKKKEIEESVLGNVGTLISFRVGPSDAHSIAKELSPKFHEDEVLRIRNYDIYLKLMLDGAPCKPFSGKTLYIGENRESDFQCCSSGAGIKH